jgi:hypothetical protein
MILILWPLMKTPTTKEAKEMILWLWNKDTLIDEFPETEHRRIEVRKALMEWAKNSIDTETTNS